MTFVPIDWEQELGLPVHVLGTEYRLFREDPSTDEHLNAVDGYCDYTVKKICVTKEQDTESDSVQDIEVVRKRQIRHEIVHAFLCESGLMNETWAQEEEIVDWIAIQGLKLYEAWKEADAV